MDLREYRTLVTKVDAFFARVRAAHPERFACRAGCSDCCRHSLSVTAVEAQAIREGLAALSPEERAALAARAAEVGTRPGPCPALAADGTCGIYDVRPIVCRTHGLPMRLPGDARLPILSDGPDLDRPSGAADAGGTLAVCELNFVDVALADLDPGDVLDLQTLGAALAVVQARAGGQSPERLRRERIVDVLFSAHFP